MCSVRDMLFYIFSCYFCAAHKYIKEKNLFQNKQEIQNFKNIYMIGDKITVLKQPKF